MRKRVLAWFVLASGSASAGAAGQEVPAFEVTDALLARITAESAPAVRAALGVELAQVRVRLGTRAEIEDALATENTPIFLRQLGDPGSAAEQARAFARALAPAMLAKYAFASDEVLVQGEAFASTAALLELPALESEPALRGVVLHELVHAADDERHDLAQVFARCATADALRAGNAVIEGHAQLVARELAPLVGCTEGFATFTRALTTPPPRKGGGAGEEFVQSMLTSYFAFSYVEGEAFLDALRREGGAEAVLRAFREPPADAILVMNPEWYSHPERRPSVAFEIEPALAALAQLFDGEEWTRQQVSVSAADMRTAMAPLPPAEIDALVATMRQNRVQVISPADAPGSPSVVLGVFEFGSAEQATAYLASYGRLQEARDELMKKGTIRIVSYEYRHLEPPAPAGLLAEKRMTINLVKVDVAALCIVRGPLAVEAMAIDAPGWDVERLLETALVALEETLDRPRSEAEPRPR